MSNEVETEALVIVGHGSHLNPHSNEPVFHHAEEVRRQDVFDEVQEAFWKEEPGLRDVLRTLATETVYVVPLFMSEGYFVDEVIPRELRLTEENDLDVDKEVHYTPPVGTHSSMTEVILERAKKVGDKNGGLAVVGHGTERNPKSADAVYQHVEKIRQVGDFKEVQALFMDEEPLVSEVTDYFDTPQIAVVPFFVADGYHTREDIPKDIGIVEDNEVNGHQIYYSGSVGTEDLVADVIIERAMDAGASGTPSSKGLLSAPEEAFIEWVEEEGSRTWGELIVRSVEDGYELRKASDIGKSELESYNVDDVSEIAKFDNEDNYRPLKGEKSLASGWVLKGLSEAELARAVNNIYPSGITNWYLKQNDRLDITSWEETADRQTGIYEVVEELEGEKLECAVEAVCGNCVRNCEWMGDNMEVTSRIPCREACSFFIAAAREFVHVNEEPVTSPPEPSDSVRRGRFSNPANIYRVRYLNKRAQWAAKSGVEQ